MKIFFSIGWACISIVLIVLIIAREPNVESLGVIIQESIYKEPEYDSSFDRYLIAVALLFIVSTIVLFIAYK